VDYDRIVSIAADNGMSLVRYATFMHADKRNGFVDYVDLSDRDLPTPGTKTCADFEFSPVEAIAVGRVPGKGATQYLVALTKDDVTLYHFRGIRPDGRLVKETTIQARADDVIGLATTPDGVVQLVRGAKRPSPAAPATGVVVERDTALGILHITDPAGGLSKRAATDSIISGQIAAAARDYRQYAPVPRGAFYDLAWPKDTAEYRRMAGFGLILITAVDQQAAELPIARAYVETANGRDSTLTLLGSIASEIPAADTSARTVFGRYRFDALYLVPLAPGWRGSVVIIDFTQGRTGFRVGRIAETTPAEVAGATTRLAARPEAAAVAVMIRREYPDFIVTK